MAKNTNKSLRQAIKELVASHMKKVPKGANTHRILEGMGVEGNLDSIAPFVFAGLISNGSLRGRAVFAASIARVENAYKCSLFHRMGQKSVSPYYRYIKNGIKPIINEIADKLEDMFEVNDVVNVCEVKLPTEQKFEEIIASIVRPKVLSMWKNMPNVVSDSNEEYSVFSFSENEIPVVGKLHTVGDTSESPIAVNFTIDLPFYTQQTIAAIRQSMSMFQALSEYYGVQAKAVPVFWLWFNELIKNRETLSVKDVIAIANRLSKTPMLDSEVNISDYIARILVWEGIFILSARVLKAENWVTESKCTFKYVNKTDEDIKNMLSPYDESLLHGEFGIVKTGVSPRMNFVALPLRSDPLDEKEWHNYEGVPIPVLHISTIKQQAEDKLEYGIVMPTNVNYVDKDITIVFSRITGNMTNLESITAKFGIDTVLPSTFARERPALSNFAQVPRNQWDIYFNYVFGYMPFMNINATGLEAWCIGTCPLSSGPGWVYDSESFFNVGPLLIDESTDKEPNKIEKVVREFFVEVGKKHA